MRSIAKFGMVVAAATLAGCQFTGSYRDAGYAASATAYTDEITPRPVYVPYVIGIPDNTMDFYPIYDDQPPHADLLLHSMSCVAGADGVLIVAAHVQDSGPHTTAPLPLVLGALRAFPV